ncbi:MAG TPA: FKBP-type peptidyl-prolyl cis-trans isomerase [Solirubrobacteraceae bacterium]|jgi:peptidylprolyl isomerase|nr:FKBP-type peptidyl-prolyl cis-trans isomerase [Solirubrobacteraceae bacterium]
MRSRYLVVASLLCAGVIAGCGGGSNNKDTANLRLPPTASETLKYTPTSTSTTSTSTTPTVTTPSSGPLAKEPTITVPKTPAPKTLQTKDIVTGTGTTAAAGDTVVVNYVGALYSNGKVFDSSWSRGQTLTASLVAPGIIQGWIDGIPGMKVGGRRELIIPPALAYKNQSSSVIPANSTLIFIVDLLKVIPASSSGG